MEVSHLCTTVTQKCVWCPTTLLYASSSSFTFCIHSSGSIALPSTPNEGLCVKRVPLNSFEARYIKYNIRRSRKQICFLNFCMVLDPEHRTSPLFFHKSVASCQCIRLLLLPEQSEQTSIALLIKCRCSVQHMDCLIFSTKLSYHVITIWGNWSLVELVLLIELGSGIWCLT